MPIEIIERLRKEGFLVLYHNYKSGCLADLSENDNNGIINGFPVNFRNNGIEFDGINSANIQIADNISLDVDTGTTISGWICPTNFENSLQNKICYKQGAYNVNLTNPTGILNFETVGLSDNLISSVTGLILNVWSHFAVTFSQITAEKNIYINGSLVQTEVAITGTISNSANDLYIGDDGFGSGLFAGIIQNLVIINKALTQFEINQLMAQIWCTKWPTSRISTANNSIAENVVKWKTGWGINAGNRNFTSGYIENSLFQQFTGTWKISTNIINGQLVKVLECVASGIVYIDMREIRSTPSEQAYGTWDWWQYKGNTNAISFSLIGDDNIIGNVGEYCINCTIDEVLTLDKSTVGNLITSTTKLTPDGWDRLRLTRSAVNEFELFLNGISVGTAIDATITTSKFIAIDMDIGDKIALSARNGDYAITKYAGVVSP